MVAKNKRLLKVMAGNFRQNQLDVQGHYDFFPKACITPSRNGNGIIHIKLDGLNETVDTGIG